MLEIIGHLFVVLPVTTFAKTSVRMAGALKFMMLTGLIVALAGVHLQYQIKHSKFNGYIP